MDGDKTTVIDELLALDADQFGRSLNDPGVIRADIPAWHPRNDEETVEEAETADDSSTQETVDYEKQYKDTQAWGTQQSQKAAQLEAQLEALKTDPDAQRQFLQELGYQIEEEPEEDELDADELATLRKELSGLKQQFEQTTSQAQQDREIQRIDDHFESGFARFSKDRGEPLDDNEKAAIIGLALTMPAEDGLPPVEKAWDVLEEMWTGRQTKWAASKKPSHRVSANGREADTKPDLSTTEAKRDFILSRLADSQ